RTGQYGGAVGQRFDTKPLADTRDAIAPDGSEVGVLLQLARGGMAHFELGPGLVSRAVAHHSVDEIWYIVGGTGQMWRRQGTRQQTVPLRPGTCVSIPAGTHFQFRCGSGAPLAAVGVTMPPWPGEREAYQVTGTWAAELSGGLASRHGQAAGRRRPARAASWPTLAGGGLPAGAVGGHGGPAGAGVGAKSAAAIPGVIDIEAGAAACLAATHSHLWVPADHMCE